MGTISSAGRLLELIRRATQVAPKSTVFDTWASVLDIPTNERAAVFEGIAGIHRLIDESKDEVRSHVELKQDLYLGALSNIEREVVNAALTNPWANHVNQFQGSNIIALEFVAEQFDRLATEQSIDRDMLRELRELIEGVVKEVVESDINQDLKRTILQKLEDARRAILLYAIDGADGLRRAAESAVGAVIVARETAKSEQHKQPFVAFVDLVNKLLDVVAKAKPMAGLMKPVIRALLGSGSEPPAV